MSKKFSNFQERFSNSQESTNLKARHETHVAVVNVFDTSYSMVDNIAALENAYKQWIREANANPSEVNMMDVATIEYNTDVNVIHEFKPFPDLKDNFSLKSKGCTSTSDALVKAIELCKNQIELYQKEGIDAHIPWIVLYTDGCPTQDMSEAKRLLDEEMKKGRYGHVKLWIVATDDADIQWCRSFTDKVIQMNDHDYKAMFDWTRESRVLMSQANPLSGTLQLPPTPMNTQIALL